MEKYNNHTVSVIIPVYNAEKFISDTIESVLNQEYKDVEIILVDDHSTDKSAEIIKKYQKHCLNVVYHRQDRNQGAAVARNTAMNIAKGRYVAFLDSDDQWCQGKLIKQLTFMAANDAAISCTAMDTFDENNQCLGKTRHVKPIIDYQLLLHNTMIATSTVIIDRNLIGDFQMPLRRGGQDYATWLMLMRHGRVCHGLNETLSHYRVQKNSLSSNKWKSIRQVWQIQTHDEGINRFVALFNVCRFSINGFMKHFIKK